MNIQLNIWAILNFLIITPISFADETSFFNPSSEAENEESKKATAEYRLLEDENRTMLENDRFMLKRDDDPNEGLQGFPSSTVNRTYPNQEKQMEGDSLKYREE